MLQLDHLVVAAQTLDAGVAHVAAALGVSPDAFSPIGCHTRMGTHNRLLALGPGCYLEVIAIDPSAPPPGRPRWFGLDSAAVQARLAHGPVLLHWVARLEPPGDLSELARGEPQCVSQVISMERGDFRWRITVPNDGSLPACGTATGTGGVGGGGLVPTLIQWDVPQTPADLLPPSGLRLLALTGTHPQAGAVATTLAELGASGLLEVEQAAGEPCLVADISTPAGARTLR